MTGGTIQEDVAEWRGQNLLLRNGSGRSPRQQKQKEKAARRAEAKQMKDDAPPDIRPEDRDADDSQPIVAATDQAVPEEEGSR